MVHEAHARGVRHIVITHAMESGWSVAQMHNAGISVANINLMTKTNPALALGLRP